jgi:CO/xanthine dehydrogenase FAD-binding subunit
LSDAEAYARPRKLATALNLIQDPTVRVLAGGTDVYASLGDHNELKTVVDITDISCLRNINEDQDYVRIGATATWSDIVDAKLPNSFDCLKLAALQVGGVQIQNAGTIAGNICNASPAADGVPPLLALNAKVELTSSTGSRVISLEKFIIGPRRTALVSNELVTAILIPKTSTLGVSSFQKLGSRKYLVISTAMVAVVMERGSDQSVKSARVSVGSCSAVAVRLHDLEKDIVGKPLSSVGCRPLPPHLFAPLAPISDIRASDRYRRVAAAELVRRSVRDCATRLQ